ncbi:uncharacterized protein BDW70DRAFT_153695 [Aspergillus foveolatus]|uniref:uncharacterized protein n=1 Tax=Aspergillus foveolatus TaxID=210207 RepID=UPI003CCCCCEC
MKGVSLYMPHPVKKYERGEEWLKGIVLCTWGTGLILVINIILTVIRVGLAFSKPDARNVDMAVIYGGRCLLVNGWETGLHLVINILSTGLLAASNYVMQCLCAPSRAAVDRAHSKNRWLDIGILSLRNFTEMTRREKVLWVILLISSLPIHMLFNLAIFSDIMQTNCNDIVIPSDLAPDEPLVESIDEENFSSSTGFRAEYIQSNILNRALENLSLGDCYTIDSWVYPSYCLVKLNKTNCQLYFHLPICLVVISCNIVKLVCMYMAARIRQKQILFTLGDALASFLDRPDTMTRGKCLMSWSDFINALRPRQNTVGSIARVPLVMVQLEQDIREGAYGRINPRKKRWYHAVSWRRWTITILFFLICLAVSWYLYALAAKWARELETLFRTGTNGGFGKPSFRALFFSNYNITSLIFIGNSPQLAVSLLYYLCNSTLSCMLMAAEYDDFALERKPLQVSRPRGFQRATYYLSIPWRYSIPMLAFSVILHWLLSQSIFLVLAPDRKPRPTTGVLGNQALGFSLLGILLTLIFMMVAMLALGGLAMRPFRSHMPLARNCSAALAAACHPPDDDTEASLEPVMWGEAVYAHCTFTSIQVIPPSLDSFYR